MADIAKLSGVSVATVSRILNKNGRYSEETEKKVLKIINDNGYKINQSAKSLRTSKTHSIGVIVPDITNEFFAKIIRAIESNITPLGYTVFVCDSNENDEMEDYHISSLVSKGVDGIIYISGKSDVKKIYETYQIPVVYIDRRPANAGVLIISDNEAGGYYATRKLIDSGCKKIVMLRDEKMFSTVKHRYIGFKNAIHESNLELPNENVIDSPVDYTNTKTIVKEFVKSHKIDGIFANNDMMALAALHGIREAGLRVPDDIKIVGFDGSTITQVCDPPITTIKQNTEIFGEKSVGALLNIIDGKNIKNDILIIPVEVIDGKTT